MGKLFVAGSIFVLCMSSTAFAQEGSTESAMDICKAEANEAGFESQVEKDNYIDECIAQINQESNESAEQMETAEPETAGRGPE